ncbi:hypothetical protein Tco_1379675 [Tanacetum coccineum]
MEAVAMTTAIQEEILGEMGVDPAHGLACLGKVNMEYENDQDLMGFELLIGVLVEKTYDIFLVMYNHFVNPLLGNDREEMACEEAELGPEEYSERLQMQWNLHQQQLEMLKHMRSYGADDQSAILEKLRQKLEKEEFENEASLLSAEEIQDIVQNRA